MLHDRLLDAAQPAQTGSTAYDALVTGAANSQGYAQAMALLLEEVGLENILAQDPVTGEMWNRVKIDGVWYNLSAYRDDLSGDRTAFLKSDAAFAALLGSDPSRWTGEHPCTSIYYDDWFLNQSQDGGDLWKSEMYYTDGSGTLYAGYLMGTTSSAGIIREETGLSQVDACAVFDGSLYLIGSQDGRCPGLVPLQRFFRRGSGQRGHYGSPGQRHRHRTGHRLPDHCGHVRHLHRLDPFWLRTAAPAPSPSTPIPWGIGRRCSRWTAPM